MIAISVARLTARLAMISPRLPRVGVPLVGEDAGCSIGSPMIREFNDVQRAADAIRPQGVAQKPRTLNSVAAKPCSTCDITATHFADVEPAQFRRRLLALQALRFDEGVFGVAGVDVASKGIDASWREKCQCGPIRHGGGNRITVIAV